MPEPSASRIYQFREQRRKFIIIVYLLAVIFSGLSLMQWSILLLMSELGIFLKDLFYICLICISVSLVTITIFIFYENLRFLIPINWLLTLIIVEGVTLGLARAVIESRIELFGTVVAIIAILMLALIIIGVCMPHDLTLDIVVLFVISIVFYVGSIFFMMLYVMVEIPNSNYVFVVFVIITIVLFTMYHAQTINGGRYAEMRLNDYLLAALIIYHDFVILFILTFYLASKISGEDDRESRNSTTTTESTRVNHPASNVISSVALPPAIPPADTL